MNYLLNFASPVRYCLLHVHLLSHIAVHLHHLYYHHFHLLSLVHSFTQNVRLGSLANPFTHRPFPHLTGLILRTPWPFSVFIQLNSWFVYMVCYSTNPARPGDLKECFDVSLTALSDDLVSKHHTTSPSLIESSNNWLMIELARIFADSLVTLFHSSFAVF